MRVEAGVALLATLVPVPSAARPPGRGGGGVAVFSDSMNTTVVTPHAEAGMTAGGEIDVDVNWTADVITSASVDVVTAATARVTDTRHEIGLSGRRPAAVAGTDIQAGYAYSFENDADSHIAHLGLARDFLEHNLTAVLNAGFSYNRFGVLGQARSDWKASAVGSTELGLTATLGLRTAAETVYSLVLVDGYQASPYRRIPILLGADLRGAQWLDERVPDVRWRHALTGRLRRAFGRRLVGTVEYRFYVDDWGVTGHTALVAGVVELPRGFSIMLRQRGSLQGRARFYQERYDRETRYRTRDRRLGPYLDLMGGARLVFTAGRLGRLRSIGPVEMSAGADAVAWRFDEFLQPDLTPFGGAGLRPVGWVTGTIVQCGAEVFF